MRFNRQIILSLVLLTLAVPAVATVRFQIWWKEKRSSTKNLAAFDLSAGKVVWEQKLPDSVNFVIERPEGVLAGCDDGHLYLMRPENGAQIWKVKLGKEVNEFHGAAEEGFLVSQDKQVYWLVGADGKIKAQWR